MPRRLVAVLVFVCGGILAIAGQPPATKYVDDDNCPGPGSGTDADPFCLIQDCIDAAADGDECVVAPGMYFENINMLGKAVTLRSSDGPDVTTIDANGRGTVIKCISGEGPDTVIEGFTITGGNANGDHPDDRGGGMRNEASSPTVTSCIFSGNSAGHAGGMFNGQQSSPAVTACTFVGNSADATNKNGFHVGRGGGMYNLDFTATRR